MKDKDKLNRLLDIIEELMKMEGNEWLIDSLMERIKKSAPIEDIAGHSLIQSIHEYCLEKVIDSQAQNFYKDFKIEEIKAQLIEDFKKMEHERRRDDFQGFALCMYQQIENITNYLYDNRIKDIWGKEKNRPAIKVFDKDSKTFVYPKYKVKTINSLVLNEERITNWYYRHKIKGVLFFHYFNETLEFNDFEFNSVFFKQDEIYQLRNTNHRGGQPSDYQKKVQDKILGQESMYYLKFYGFLEEFVRRVNISLDNSEPKSTSKNTVPTRPKIIPTKNTLGEFSSQLGDLKKKMENEDN